MIYINSNYSAAYIISDSQKQLIVLVNYVFLSGFVSLFGSVANVINMIVFYRQGLGTTINISFFFLAVSDLCSLVLQQTFNLYINPLFVGLDLPIVYRDLQYLVSGMFHAMFARITCLITVFITAERCLCVVYPLHVRRIITPKVTVTVIVVIFSFTLSSPVPFYCTCYYTWKFYPNINRTLLALADNKDRNITEAFVYFTHAVFTMLGFLLVLTFTLILTYKLGQKSAWRQTANVDRRKAKSMSKRDKAAISMVVLIAGILIVCYTPAVLLCLTTFVVPQFTVGGLYFNAFYSCWSIAMLFENINSSVNIFLYYKMSSRYRQTLRNLVPACFGLHKKPQIKRSRTVSDHQKLEQLYI